MSDNLPYKPAWFKKYLPHSLFGRSLLILIVPIFLIQIVTMVVFLDRHWGRMTSKLTYAVAGEIAMVVNSIESNTQNFQTLKDLYKSHLNMRLDLRPNGVLPQNYNQNTDMIWGSMVAQSLHTEMQDLIDHPFNIQTDFKEKWITIWVETSSGILEVKFPRSRLFSSSSYIFLLWMFGVSLLMLFIAILFMRNQIRPIRKLAVVAEAFGKGREYETFRPSGAREVRQASEAFLKMKHRIKRQIEQRTAMLAGVSHDLRTPLTRLKLQLEVMDTSDADEMRGDIEEMERMIESYLEFVRGGVEERISLSRVTHIIQLCIDNARKSGGKIHYNKPQNSIDVALRPQAFQRMIQNILDNAIKFANEVWVSIEHDDTGVFIQVEDNGRGIPKDEREDVFRPFYRIEDSRNTQSGGVGLGLSIVMDVVTAHGGHITLGDSEKGGLLVNIFFPS